MRYFPEMRLFTGAPAHVLREKAHILHDQPWLFKDLGIDAL
jgi:hypothetical protein